jgi:hypothetical protein
MDGVIRTWDVLAHPITAIRCLGWRVFFKAALPWRHETLLALLEEGHYFGAASGKMPELFQRSIAVEWQAQRIYAVFARVFAEFQPESRFFAVMAQQEQEHAELLQLCENLARRVGWKVEPFNTWHDLLPRLEQRLQTMESSLSEIGSLDDALRMVVQIESSEINEVFRGVVRATQSTFIRKLKPYREAIDRHIAYICRCLTDLAPALRGDCQKLRNQFCRA